MVRLTGMSPTISPTFPGLIILTAPRIRELAEIGGIRNYIQKLFSIRSAKEMINKVAIVA